MIVPTQPNRLGTLNPNDKFKFEGDDKPYYFIGNYGISGFVYWDDNDKKIITIPYNLNWENYLKIKVFVEN